MKAAQITSFEENNIAVLEVAQPAVEPGKVLVKVYAASLNPFDSTVRKGLTQSWHPLNLPATIGGDFAGVVQGVGEGVTGFNTGDAVYGQASLFREGTGSMAEYAVTPSDEIAQKPEQLSFDEAAATPLTGCSAIQALMEHLNLQKGERILIHGGAGGIGTIAIQLAKHLGAYVITTVATDEIDYVKSLGVDEVIDYKTQKFEEVFHNLDAVYDTVGGDTYERSFKVLKPGGRILSMLVKPNEALMKEYGVTAMTQQTKVNTDHLDTLSKLIEDGVITIHVDKVFSLEKTAEAFVYRETNRPRGKVVVHIID